MSAAKAFIFAPADPTEEVHRMLTDQGCEVVPRWQRRFGGQSVWGVTPGPVPLPAR